MRIKSCVECGHDMSSKSTVCPNCGYRRTITSGCLNGGRRLKIIGDGFLTLIGLTILVGILNAFFGNHSRIIESDEETVRQVSSPSYNGRSRITAPQWYEGGTLYGKTLSDWTAAPYSNRLATSADLLNSLLKIDNIPFPGYVNLKGAARKMEKELSDTASVDGAGNLRVTEVASTIWVYYKQTNDSLLE